MISMTFLILGSFWLKEFFKLPLNEALSHHHMNKIKELNENKPSIYRVIECAVERVQF